jgi:hypothetical protein
MCLARSSMFLARSPAVYSTKPCQTQAAMSSYLPGARVVLEGLVRNPDLNSQMGTLVEVHAGRATVDLVSGRRVSARLHCIRRAAEQPSSTGRQNEQYQQNEQYRPAERAVPADPYRAVQTRMPPMDWGSSSLSVFRKSWEAEIAWNDPVFFRESGRDIYEYMKAKVFHVVNTAKRPGQAGWRFRMAKPSDCICCTVWGDGTHGQSSALGLDPYAYGERWWPCIVLDGETDKLPFYCPALAWQNSRPWEVHVSRLRRVGLEDAGLEEAASGSAASAEPNESSWIIINTPGPWIEEIFSEDGTSDHEQC